MSSRVQSAGDGGSRNSDTHLPTARHHIPASNLNIQCHTHPTTPTLIEEHGLKVFENRLVVRGRKSQETGEKCIMRNFILCIPQQILFE